MSLPVKKIYIDSAHRTDNSVSASNFSVELPYSITMPHNAIFLIDEICVPHAWFSIEAGINDKIYIHVHNTSSRVRYSIIGTMPSGNYNGPLFQSTLQAVLSGVNPAGSGFDLVVAYDNLTFSLTIGLGSTDVYNQFWVLSDYEIQNRLRSFWDVGLLGPGGNIDTGNPASMNDVFRNYDVKTQTHNRDDVYRSGFLNFQGISNLYLSSPNLGTFTTIGTRGEATIIKKIPVSSDFGFMIIDRSISVHDYLECGKSTLRTLEFHLKDSKGRYIPMHGSNISFSLVFALKAED